MILYNILIPIILGIIMNAIIYIFKLNKKEESTIKWIPPGYIIGIIWIILLGLLGYIHYLLYDLTKNINIAMVFVLILITYCISYPLITQLKENKLIFYNMIGLILSYLTGFIIIFYSKYIFLFLVPLLLWITYINLIFVKDLS
jgi:tryptophan-rich sensory protein